MIKFLINLFNLHKKKQEDFIEVEMDKANGKMIIRTNRELSPEDIINILREQLGEEDDNL